MSLRVSRVGRVERVTMDRVDKRNALNEAACTALIAAIEAAQGDRGVGAVVLDAEGPAFCAGMDLDEALGADAVERTAVHGRLFTMVDRLRKPLVVAVQGPAVAGGVGLVAQGHFVVAEEQVQFSLPEARIGMWPFVIWGALARALGERRALELSLTGRRFGAAEAREWGLVDQVVEEGQARETAMGWAEKMAEMSPEAVERGLALAREARGMDLEESARLAARYREGQFAGRDFREGVAAMREKRRPRWPSSSE